MDGIRVGQIWNYEGQRVEVRDPEAGIDGDHVEIVLANGGATLMQRNTFLARGTLVPRTEEDVTTWSSNELTIAANAPEAGTSADGVKRQMIQAELKRRTGY